LFAKDLAETMRAFNELEAGMDQERDLCSRTNFKLNRTAALAEWRQLGAA
jgi:putative transposase